MYISPVLAVVHVTHMLIDRQFVEPDTLRPVLGPWRNRQIREYGEERLHALQLLMRNLFLFKVHMLLRIGGIVVTAIKLSELLMEGVIDTFAWGRHKVSQLLSEGFAPLLFKQFQSLLVPSVNPLHVDDSFLGFLLVGT